MEVEKIMQDLAKKHPGEPEFLQAVEEVLNSIKDVYNQHPEFEKAKLIERLVEPERVIMFRVRSEEHTSELQSRQYLVCRLLLEKKQQNHLQLHVFDLDMSQDDYATI